MTSKLRRGEPAGQVNSMKRHIFRFGCVGVVGFLVDAGTLYLLLNLGFGFYGGRAASFLLAVLCTWLLNRTFTFDTQKVGNGPPGKRGRPGQQGHPGHPATRVQILAREFGKYLLAMAAGGCVNYLAYCFALSRLPHAPISPLIAVATGSIAGLFVNFTATKFWVYR